MKGIYRYALLILCALFYAFTAVRVLPDDNLLVDIFAENPNAKIVMIAILSAVFLAMFLISVQIMSFFSCVFCRVGSGDKVSFEPGAARDYGKASAILFIALHVPCLGLQLLFGYFIYAAVYVLAGLLLCYFLVQRYKQRNNPSLNIMIAMVPQIVYIFGQAIYSYFSL